LHIDPFTFFIFQLYDIKCNNKTFVYLIYLPNNLSYKPMIYLMSNGSAKKILPESEMLSESTNIRIPIMAQYTATGFSELAAATTQRS